MKKIIALMFIVLLMVPAISIAVTTKTGEPITGACATSGCPTDTISVLSNKVSLIASSSDTMYAVASGHSSGSKVYGSTSGETKLFSKAASDPLNLSSDAGVSDSDTNQFSGWMAL